MPGVVVHPSRNVPTGYTSKYDGGRREKRKDEEKEKERRRGNRGRKKRTPLDPKY